jgi:hypothetical protein
VCLRYYKFSSLKVLDGDKLPVRPRFHFKTGRVCELQSLIHSVALNQICGLRWLPQAMEHVLV